MTSPATFPVRVTFPDGAVLQISAAGYAALADAGRLGHHTAERAEPPESVVSAPACRGSRPGAETRSASEES